MGLVLYSLRLPYYTNSTAKEKLESTTNDQIISSGGKSYDKIKAKYYSEIEKLRTKKTWYFDLGSGISISMGCILLFLIIDNIKNFKDLLRIKSFNKASIFFIAIPMWLLMIPGMVWYYTFRGERGDYPMFADSIAIPIMYGSITILIGLIVLIPFLVITTWKSTFPTYIFIKPERYNTKATVTEAFWGLLLLLNLCCFVCFVLGGDHVSIIVNLVFTYLILVLRAGQINSYKVPTSL